MDQETDRLIRDVESADPIEVGFSLDALIDYGANAIAQSVMAPGQIIMVPADVLRQYWMCACVARGDLDMGGGKALGYRLRIEWAARQRRRNAGSS